MTQQWKVDQTVDCRGLIYPGPILKAKKALDGLEADQVLEVLATDPNSRPDLPIWAERIGVELLGIEDAEGMYRFYVRKTE